VKIYIGLDEREPEATRAAVVSLRKVCNIEPELLYLPKLEAQGLVNRVRDQRGGQDYDFGGNANESTRFAVSRFLVPIVCQEQWALFVDADVIFFEDPRAMLRDTQPGAAAYVVKHQYEPTSAGKMVGQVNARYSRKNWSSVVLFNTLHPANQRLSLRDINERPGRDLHSFYWLNDSELGELPARWNWLVNVQPRPADLGIGHWTLGGPFTKDWPGAEHDDLWLQGADPSRL
jgi:hypothetical protein